MSQCGAAAGCLMTWGRARTQPADLSELAIEDSAALIRARAVSPVELTQAYLDRIERLDSRVNAYITVTADQALEQARSLEAELDRGRWRGPLHGIPIAL